VIIGLGPFHDFEDAVGDQAVRLAMNTRRRLGVGSLDQAERLVVLFVDPVLDVLDAVSLLLGQISLVSVSNVGRGRTCRQVLGERP